MKTNGGVRLFLCGDVMTGRGIDQILPFPSSPEIYEHYLKRATDYVRIAEEKSGPIPRSVGPEYIWGDALEVFKRTEPHLRIINLETAITRSDGWVNKGINYRMSPENASCLGAAQIDVCALANNHILDWGEQGLLDTIENLERLKIKSVGAGRNREEACRPAVLTAPGGGRVIVFAAGAESSGVPRSWAASSDRPGVEFLEERSDRSVESIRKRVAEVKRDGDIVVLSIHWGSNWGYEIPRAQQRLAHALIDEAQVDLIHGHSSHHFRAMEVYRGKLILYGCGDLITDYEGITGYEEFRGDFGLMYFPRVSSQTGELMGCEIVPLKMNRFQLIYPTEQDVLWLKEVMCREGRKGRTSVSISGQSLVLNWEG